jgi:hypothetical protein
MATSYHSDVGYLYNHETGNDADGSPMDNVFIESSDFALGNGEEFQSINKNYSQILNLQEAEEVAKQLILF